MVFKYLTIHLTHMVVMAGNGYGLVGLYKDIESNGGYADIQVMWDMIHSSHPPNVHTIKRSKRVSRRFCFMPS